MNKYDLLSEKSLSSGGISEEECVEILSGREYELLPLLNAAFTVRSRYFGKSVRIHVIDNVKNGGCSEDCSYCAQSKSSEGGCDPYPAKNPEEIMEEAERAYSGGAFRHCLVFSGSTQSANGFRDICGIVGTIKGRFPMEVCVSAGFLDDEKAKMLKAAGVDRYNHNLNTSRKAYGSICTSHTYEDRLDTLKCARDAGLDVCSGVIIGMGEGAGDIVSLIGDLKSVGAKSVPVNFFIPVKGNRVNHPQALTPEYCLRALCVFRFMLPDAEIRAAGGREYHMRSLQSLCMYPANSLFASGYLTHGGDDIERTIRMIEDAGFFPESVG
jgi:biotin synthase